MGTAGQGGDQGLSCDGNRKALGTAGSPSGPSARSYPFGEHMAEVGCEADWGPRMATHLNHQSQHPPS